MWCDWRWPGVLFIGRIDTRNEEERMGTNDGTQASELRDLIAQLTPHDGTHKTAIPSLYLARYSSSLMPAQCGVLTPALCIAAQGQKELLLGDNEVYAQTPDHYLVASAELPVVARILGATFAKPFLGVRVHFEVRGLRSLIEEARLPTPVGAASG